MSWAPLVLVGVALAVVTTLPRSNPSAAEESERFHGEPTEVRRLSAAERRSLPKEVVVLGEATEITYAPSARSKRGGDLWRHTFTDRGPGRPRATRRPLLIADPRNHHLGFVGGDARFAADRGIEG